MSDTKRPNPTTIRLPEQARALLLALQAKTGRPQSQLIIQAIEELAKQQGITL